MKFLIVACLFCFSSVVFAEDAALAGTTSVLKTDAPAAQQAKTDAVVVVSGGCSDCRSRRRVLGGYVVVKHSVFGNCTTTTREVVDNCCNTVRSRTVTKTGCGCRDCRCVRCDCR